MYPPPHLCITPLPYYPIYVIHHLCITPFTHLRNTKGHYLSISIKKIVDWKRKTPINNFIHIFTTLWTGQRTCDAVVLVDKVKFSFSNLKYPIYNNWIFNTQLVKGFYFCYFWVYAKSTLNLLIIILFLPSNLS